MQHWIAIVGSTLGIAGTAALSFDLLRSKTVEGSMKQFQQLQDELHAASQELTVRTTEGLRSEPAVQKLRVAIAEVRRDAYSNIRKDKFRHLQYLLHLFYHCFFIRLVSCSNTDKKTGSRRFWTYLTNTGSRPGA